MPLKNLNDYKNEVIENENVIVGSGAWGGNRTVPSAGIGLESFLKRMRG